MYNTVLLNNFLDFLEGLNGFQTTVPTFPHKGRPYSGSFECFTL